ncbi:MAG TPA: carboxy terminal-processing peptidase [Fibrobacteria bacterium]|nr:carboxy terminal-processing peptidase [Fibrobacteria bacterium]
MRALRAFLCVVAAFSVASAAARDRESVLSRLQTRSLYAWHYAPQPLDDALSKRIFDLYLKRLDPQKRFLLRSDVDSLARLRDKIDDQLRTGDFAFVDAANALLTRRVAEARTLSRDLIRGGLDLSIPDSIGLDARKYGFPADAKERRKHWTRLLKLQLLARIEGEDRDDDDEKDAKAGKPSRPIARPDSAALEAARAYVERSLQRSFARMERENRSERVALFLGAVANAFDPHTAYLEPEGREEFNMAMSGKLEGIGATLREDDGYIRVVAIIPGSASWRQRELKAEDRILKVAQGSDEPVDLSDASVQEAVRLIRGPKGTEVRLTVRKPDGRIKVIPITRDVVVVEESYAKSAVLEAPGSGVKVGYISLPSFYHDFQSARGRSSAADVRRELERLKAQGAGAIVLDLRNNGGGSLDDAVKMSGLFLPWGPMVQVRDREGAANVLEDTDPGVVFDGPLAVLVNTFSASASEIMAAAMQDYGRAVIIGTDTTFGKGTVQTLIDFDNLAAPSDASFKPLGTLKLTIQKFYRVNGGSTQFRGVVPDILIPDGYTQLDMGEKSQDYPLPWDTARPLRIQRWSSPPPLADLQARSRARVDHNAFFKRLDTTLRARQARRGNDQALLSLDRYLADRERSRLEGDTLEALQKLSTGLTATPLASLNAAIAADSLEKEKAREWKEQLSKDSYLREAVDVLGDWAKK